MADAARVLQEKIDIQTKLLGRDNTTYELILALNAYRHGKFVEATNQASKALIPGDAIPERQAITCLLLGMAQFQLKDGDAGRRSLAKAAEITARKLKKSGRRTLGLTGWTESSWKF